MKGFEIVCAMTYDEATQLVEHPVSCIDCHDPQSMRLRVTRPGFINGIQALAESDDPVPHLPSVERWRRGDREQPYEPNGLASRQEMRSLACAQCHVEYYFRGDGKLLVYPWHNRLKVEQMETYYESAGKDGAAFKDWTHKLSGAPMLKAQHPEFVQRAASGSKTVANAARKSRKPYGPRRYQPKSSNRIFSGSTPRPSSICMHALSMSGGPQR